MILRPCRVFQPQQALMRQRELWSNDGRPYISGQMELEPHMVPTWHWQRVTALMRQSGVLMEPSGYHFWVADHVDSGAAAKEHALSG